MPDDPRVTVRRTRFELPIRTDEHLKLYLARAHRLALPDRHVCRDAGRADHSTPFDAFADGFFARTPVQLWKASRQLGGKSHTLGALGVTEAQTLPGCEIALLGGSGEQAKRVHESMQEFWRSPSSPRYMLAGDPSAERTRLHNGSSIKVQMASSRSVRGPHPQRLRLDEVDEMDLSIFWDAMGQPMTKRGIVSNVVGASTHHYDAGTFEELLDLAPEKGWGVHEWCLEETRASNGGWVSEEAIERLRTQMSEEAWATEVELQRPSRGLRVFPSYTRERHVAAAPFEIDPNLPVWVGLDFGFLRFAWCVFQIWPRTGLVAVYEAGLWRQCATEDGAQRLAAQPWAKRLRASSLGCDPAGNSRDPQTGIRSVEIIDRAFERPVSTWSYGRDHHDPEWRAELIRTLLCDASGQSRVILNPGRCASLERAFRFLSYPESVKAKETPEKEDELDDPIDALGYGLVAALWSKPTVVSSKRPWR